ncbi:MAG: sugar phosphate isomerase/epimerase [Treponema sp.]|jgi:sugar phosphate isomerase/epimerase|nr:sugar phosphate isomerase/epimerase [Treponema sp.]
MSLIKEFAIQLWSVRDITNSDFAGTLKKLAQMGYTGVEFAGYGGLSDREMKEILTTNGLKSIGAHVGLDRLENQLDEEIAYHKALGTEYIICPHSKIETKEDTLRIAKTLKPVVKKVNDAGMKFAYHNHAHEFVQSEGEYLLDILFANLPPEAAMELDIFWVSYAGVEPFAYMEKHKDRLKLIHVKQIDKDKNCVDLDQGVLDYREIITKAKGQGVEHFILEQEKYAVSSIVSVKNNIDYIMGL